MDFNRLVTDICQYYSVSPSDVFKWKRNKNISKAKRMMYVMAHEFLDMSYSDIARCAGLADHSSVSHTVKKFKRDHKQSPELQKDVTYFIEEFSKHEIQHDQECDEGREWDRNSSGRGKLPMYAQG